MTTGRHSLSERVHLTFDVVYSFDRPARHLNFELRVRPLLAAGQGLAPIRLASEPEARFEPPELDENGTAVDRLKLAGPVSRLRLNASFDHPVSPYAALPALPPTAADLMLEGLADATGSMPWPQVLADLRESWRYSDNPHHPPQTLAEIAQTRVGSCEAIARLAVEIIRARGVPARLVGGYRLAGLPGDTRMVRRHAWIAVWDGTQWRSLDPLALPGTASVLIATASGSRLAEIAVVRGTFEGARWPGLTISAHVERRLVQDREAPAATL